MKTYRFPIPRTERVLLLVGAILGFVVPAGVFLMIRGLAESMDLSVGDVFARSTAVRASYGAMWIAYACSLYGLLAFHRIKEGTRLEVADESVRFHRPGAPLTGWGAVDVTIHASDVDRVLVQDVQRGTVKRIELEVGAGRTQIRANLAHATSGADAELSSVDSKSAWLEHPLVKDVSSALDRAPEAV